MDRHGNSCRHCRHACGTIYPEVRNPSDYCRAEQGKNADAAFMGLMRLSHKIASKDEDDLQDQAPSQDVAVSKDEGASPDEDTSQDESASQMRKHYNMITSQDDYASKDEAASQDEAAS
jgi:hypothetical protein